MMATHWLAIERGKDADGYVLWDLLRGARPRLSRVRPDALEAYLRMYLADGDTYQERCDSIGGRMTPRIAGARHRALLKQIHRVDTGRLSWGEFVAWYHANGYGPTESATGETEQEAPRHDA